MEGIGDVAPAPLQDMGQDIYLLPGDLGLSQFEDRLSASWPLCLQDDIAAFRSTTAFYRIVHSAAAQVEADIVFIDVGPNLGAINRSALIASDYIVVPLAPGLFSLQGLRNLGPTLHTWRDQWQDRLKKKPAGLDIPMPSGAMQPTGYVVMQHVERKSRPVKAYQRWVGRIPHVYERYILEREPSIADPETDPNLIGFIKNYQSLMPLAEDAHKPVFKLTPADGAIGAHAAAVTKCYMDFKRLTEEILARTGQIAHIADPAAEKPEQP